MRRSILDEVEEVTLQPWQEVLGKVVSIARTSEHLKLVVQTTGQLAITIPQDALVGEVPSEGAKISLLRTGEGYRIKVRR